MLGRLVVFAALAAGSAACTIETKYPALDTQDVRLTILHTSDIHSRLIKYRFNPGSTDQGLGLDPDASRKFGVGGIDRMTYIVNRERQLAQRVIHLDAGDAFQGAPIYNLWHGEPEYRTLSEMGADVSVVGNHEFDSGAAPLQKVVETWARFPVLVANYEFRDWTQPWANTLGRITQPWTVIDANGLRVGVVGMGDLESLFSIVEQGNSLGIVPIETIEAAKKAVAQVKAVSDFVIILSHMGLDADVVMAKNVPDVDLILGGHLHIVLSPPKTVTGVGGRQVVIAHSGAFAKFLGRYDLVLRKSSDPAAAARDGFEIATYKYKIFPIDSSVDAEIEKPDHADYEMKALQKVARVREILEPYKIQLAQRLDLGRTVGCSSLEALKRFGATGGDSPLGNLTAEAMQLHPRVEADFGLTNSPGIRDDLRGVQYENDDSHACVDATGASKYAITQEELFNVLPFENTVTTMFLSGVEVKELFDYVARRTAERGCSAQAQISGARVTIVCGGDEHSPIPHADDIEVGGCNYDTALGRVACTPINLNGTYELATNDYVAAGGSGFEVLKRNTTQYNTYISMRDAVAEYMGKVGIVPCRVGDPELPACTGGFAAAAVEDGRIQVRY